jgi:hypothetical protein
VESAASLIRHAVRTAAFDRQPALWSDGRCRESDGERQFENELTPPAPGPLCESRAGRVAAVWLDGLVHVEW